MTITERDEIKELRQEWTLFRDEMAPAIELAANLAIAGRAIAASARFVKWGVGVGAAVVTMAVGLSALGLL